jgi:REP element-mobilizing transposase RayT
MLFVTAGIAYPHYISTWSSSRNIEERRRLLRIERPDLEQRYWNHVLWSPSYFAASCGGAPLGIIKQHVEQQKTPL